MSALFYTFAERYGWLVVPLAPGITWWVALLIEPHSQRASRILMGTVGISVGFFAGAFAGMALGMALGILFMVQDGFVGMGLVLWMGIAGALLGALAG